MNLSKGLSGMTHSQNTMVIGLSPSDKTIHCYARSAGQIVHDTRKYRCETFDTEFYRFMTESVQEFARTYSPASAAETTIVLPDRAVFTDLLTFPAMKKVVLHNSIKMAVDGIYKNRDDLKINTHLLLSNKQTAAYSLAGVSVSLLNAVKTACVSGKLVAQNVTFAANAAINALSSLNPKLKAATYLFLDIKERETHYIYVFRGHAVGFYTLPFGYSILEGHKPAAEDLLLDHPVAELAVLNAREKAKAKALTMMGDENDEAIRAGENPDSESSFAGADQVEVNRTDGSIKTLGRKVARKLPKFMQREIPDTEDGMLGENFRLFVKWALCFLAGNARMTALGQPAVYVNLPKQYGRALEITNEESEENGVVFQSAGLEKQPDDIARFLELYGGMLARRMNTENNF